MGSVEKVTHEALVAVQVSHSVQPKHHTPHTTHINMSQHSTPQHIVAQQRTVLISLASFARVTYFYKINLVPIIDAD